MDNNPVKMIDLDGRKATVSVIAIAGNENSPQIVEHHFLITAKLLDLSSTTSQDFPMAAAEAVEGSLKRTMEREYELTDPSGTSTIHKYLVSMDVTIVTSMKDVAYEDHLIVLVDGMRNLKGGLLDIVAGTSVETGHKVVYVDRDYLLGTLGEGDHIAHEFGHLLGLSHSHVLTDAGEIDFTHSPNDLMSYTKSKSAVFTIEQLEEMEQNIQDDYNEMSYAENKTCGLSGCTPYAFKYWQGKYYNFSYDEEKLDRAK
jgi:hypothetical protein